MKKIIYSLLSVLLVAVTLISCVEDTDYDTPQISCDEPVLTGNAVDLTNIITLWQNSTDPVVIFDEDYPDYIVGYVTSNDKTGNFYKELFIQDAPTNPTAALKVSIDVRSLYTKYDVGRKVYIYMNGLAVGMNNSGELMIAEDNNGAQSDDIRENIAKENIKRNCEVVAITPLVVNTPAAINDTYLGMFIQFDNMQFDLSLLNENFVNPADSFDTHHLITSCENGSTIQLETSTFASFKNSPLPQGAGSVSGILTKDYGDDFYVLRVNNPEAFSFTGERCDPDIIDCGTATVEGANTLFEDDFSSYATGSPITGNGWTNFLQEGTEQWEAYSDSYSLGVSARLNPYNNGSASVVSWFITPMINMDAQTGEVLTFKTSNSFSDTSTLDVLYSNDWDGVEANITSATWAIVSQATVVSDDTYYQTWIDSGLVDLSCAEGNSYIAFRFKGDGGGSSSSFNGTYELDDVKITSD